MGLLQHGPGGPWAAPEGRQAPLQSVMNGAFPLGVVPLGQDLALFALAPAGGLLAGGALFLPRHRAYWRGSYIARVARRHWLPIAAGILIVAVNTLETALDPAWSRWLGWDFTAFFARVDGDLVASVQAVTPRWLADGLAIVYVVLFPFVLYFSPFYYAWLDDGVRLQRAVWSIGLCYLAALPFYLFFPVNEAWYHYDTVGQAAGHPAIHNWARDLPGIGGALYQFSGVNNNFPSLHTALSAATAAVAFGRAPANRHGGSRLYAPFTIAIAGLTAVSTLVLGIHWTLDVAAGLLLAAGVAWTVRRIVPDQPAPEPALGAVHPSSAAPALPPRPEAP